MSNQTGMPTADLSKLKSILSGAKAIMNKTESGSYETGNVNLDTTVTGNQLIEGTGQQETSLGPISNPAPQIVNGKGQYRNMETSKMPDIIKQAMMNNPMPQLSMANSSFSLEDVQDLVEKPVQQPRQQPRQQPKQIQESSNVQRNSNDTFTVSESSLRGIIKDVVKDELLRFMSETFAKKLTEQTIKKTINTLIREGKLKTKKTINN